MRTERLSGARSLPVFPEDRYAMVGDLRIRYWMAGNAGSPVVLIHGLGLSAEVWMFTLETLARRRRIFVPDLPGFGRSENPAHYSTDFLVSFIDEFLKACSIDEVTLVGSSLGGGLSLLYALAHPERVQNLVLIGSAGFGRDISAALRLLTLPVLGECVTTPSRRWTRLLLRTSVFDTSLITAAEVTLFYKLSRLPGNQKAFLSILRSACSLGGVREEILGPIRRGLPGLVMPALLLWGDRDAVIPLRYGEKARSLMPKSSMKVLHRCGHLPPYERPDETCDAILDFLDRQGIS
ncbi:MAG: alpha/beta fold hydrolase [Deltaproteobacteria bacterium]|nr:alpha/beta fold hydrolase [Deltaproteobacteria bacterium]